jgi:hypothetical protein
VTWLLLVLLSLATFRATRLAVRDDFPPLLWLRWKIIEARPGHVNRNQEEVHWWLGELVSCRWCASGWISLALVGSVWALHGIPLPIVCWLAVWGAGAVLTDRLQ